MKIALVYDAVYPWIRGGGEANLRSLGERLAARGHRVDAVGMKWWDGPSVREEGGVRLVGVSPAMPLYGPDGQRRVAPPIAFAAGALAWLSRERYDLVDCCAFPYLPALGLVARSRARPLPLLLTWFEVWGAYWREYLGPAGRVAETVERAVARGARFHLAHAPLAAERVRALHPRAVVRMVPTAIEESPPEGVSPDPFLIGWCGRAVPHKDLPLLLDTLALLPRASPYRLAVIGDGPSLGDWKAHARAVGVEDRVSWLGFLPTREDVLRTLAGCGVVVQTSRREGQGRAALEALAMGCPLVVVEGAEVATTGFVADGVSARVVPAGSPEALARAIEGVVVDASMRARLAAGGAEVLAAMRWDRVLPAIEAYYEEVSASVPRVTDRGG